MENVPRYAERISSILLLCQFFEFQQSNFACWETDNVLFLQHRCILKRWRVFWAHSIFIFIFMCILFFAEELEVTVHGAFYIHSYSLRLVIQVCWRFSLQEFSPAVHGRTMKWTHGCLVKIFSSFCGCRPRQIFHPSVTFLTSVWLPAVIIDDILKGEHACYHVADFNCVLYFFFLVDKRVFIKYMWEYAWLVRLQSSRLIQCFPCHC